MPSTYTLNNGIELIGTGEQSGTWGDTTNTNFELLDTALDGQVSVTLAATGSSGSPNTLPISDGASSNGRNRLVIFGDGGDLGGTAYVQLTPNDSEKIIYVRNSLSGSRSILLFQGTYNASNDYEVPAGTTAVVFFNGAGTGAVAANVFNNAFFDSLRLGSVSVDKILDEDNMASNDAAALATQQSIKAYVDSQVGTVDTLAEILANGNTTGGNDIVFSAGDNITNASGDLTLDVAGDIILDADGGDFKFRDGGAGFFTISNSSLDAVLKVEQSNEDFIIKGNDGGSEITALTLDMSEAGAATFNSGVTLSGDLTVDTDTLYVDSANDRVTINSSGSNASGDLIVGNTTGGVFTLTRVSEDIAQNNLLGRIDWFNDDNSGEGENIAAQIGAYAATSLGEDAYLQFHTKAATAGGGTAGNTLSLLSDGTVNVANGGSESSPILVLQGDTDTGQWRPDANTIAWSTQGNEVLRFDSSQRVLIGTTTSQDIGSKAANLQIRGLSGQDAAITIVRNDSGVVGGSFFVLGKSRGDAEGDATIVSDGDTLGTIRWAGADGTDVASPGAEILGEVDGTPGANDMPGRLVFSTTADGASSATERMRITNGGRVGINTVGESGTPLGYLTIDNDINSANVLTNKASYHVVLGVNGSHTGEYIGGIGFGDITQSTIQAAISVTDEGTSAAAGIAFATGNTSAVNEAMRITSTQSVLIGTDTVDTNFSGKGIFQVAGENTAPLLTVTRYQANSSGAYVRIGKSRGTSPNTRGVLSNNDDIGYLQWVADDGQNVNTGAAQITASIDGTPGANDLPGRLVFYTTADGASSGTERMRISSDGNIVINTVGAKLYFQNSSGAAPYIQNAGTNNSDLTIATNGSERMRINSNGAVGINSSGYVKTNAAQFLTLGDGASASGAGLDIIRGEALSGGTGPVIKMFHGPDSGTQVEQRIASVVGDLIISADHQDVHSGTTMEFYIDGSRKLLLNGAGNLVLNSGAGVDFSATGDGSGTETSELLDDYEEGTFTATLGFRVSSTGSLNYTRNTFRYIKVGSSVFITGFLTWNQNNFTANNGAMQLQGLPYTFANTQLYRGGVNVVYSDAEFSGVTIYQQGFRNEQAESNMIFNFSDTTNGAMDSTIDSYSNIPSSGGMMITGTYTTL